MWSYQELQVAAGLFLVLTLVFVVATIFLWQSRQERTQEIRRLEMKAENDRKMLGYFLGKFITRFIQPLADDLSKELPIDPKKPRIPKAQYAKLKNAVSFATDLFTTLGVDVEDIIGPFLDRYGIVFECVSSGKGASAHTYKLDAGAGGNSTFVVTYR